MWNENPSLISSTTPPAYRNWVDHQKAQLVQQVSLPKCGMSHTGSTSTSHSATAFSDYGLCGTHYKRTLFP